MFLSKYTKVIPHYPIKNKFVVSNLLYDSLCIINANVFKKLESIDKELELRERLSDEEYHTLSRLHILKDLNEKKRCTELLQQVLDVKQNLNLIVYLTNQCNLNCYYCFQSNMLRNKSLSMDIETAKLLERWIISFCRKKRIKNLSLLFYGGEPLLNKNILEHIAQHISQASKRFGIKYDFLMTTNGTILDIEFIRKLKSYGLSDIQITLDGNREIHDARRPFKNGELSSYECIMDNLKSISKITRRIILRINVDRNNTNDVPFFIKMLEKIKLGNKVKIFLMPVFQPVSRRQKWMSALIPQNKIADYLLNYYSLAKNLNLTIIPYYSAGFCQFYGKFSFSITPDGNIYKCPNLLQDYFRVGDLKHGLSEKRNERVRNVSLKECLDCKFILVCAKGCRSQAYIKNHDINGRFCEKETLEKLMSFYIKHETEVRLNADGRRKKQE